MPDSELLSGVFWMTEFWKKLQKQPKLSEWRRWQGMTLMINAKSNSQKWMFWLILSVVTIYLTLTLHWLLQNQQQQQKLQTTLEALPLLIPVQQLTQQLQAERGMLSGFATQKLPMRPAIELQQLQTDAAWRDLQFVIDSNISSLANTEDFLATLPRVQQLYLLRQKVLEQQLKSTVVKRSYTDLLQPFLDLAVYLQQKNEVTDLEKPLAAIVALTHALELAGKERATLNIAFAEMQMSPSRYQSYVILVNEQMDYLQEFVRLSSPDLQQQWQNVQSQFENGAFIELRAQALAQKYEGDLGLWFTLATARIDRIYQLRYELCGQLQQQAQEIHLQLQSSSQQFLAHLQALSLIFLLLCWRLYRLYQSNRPKLYPIRQSPQF